jgi:hypothetical protein
MKLRGDKYLIICPVLAIIPISGGSGKSLAFSFTCAGPVTKGLTLKLGPTYGRTILAREHLQDLVSWALYDVNLQMKYIYMFVFSV